MHPTDDLRSRLEKSASVSSLRSEMDLISILNQHRWECHHSAYYLDSIEHKLREIDILADYRGVRQTKRREERSNIRLVIEAKNISDWQIVFSKGEPHDELCGYTTRIWSGFIDSEKYRWIAEALLESGINDKTIPKLLSHFQQMAFKNGKAVIPPYFEPPNNLPIVTAFRETNTDKEKGIDNSVFWRAVTGLQSSIKSLKQHSERWHQDCFSCINNSGKKMVDDFEFNADLSLGTVDVFHPIIVIDANLWVVDQQSLTPITSCRFHQINHTGMVGWWCDVVNTAAFPSYIDTISQYYTSAFHKSDFTLNMH